MKDNTRFAALLLTTLVLSAVACDGTETVSGGSAGHNSTIVTAGGRTGSGGTSSGGSNRGGSSTSTTARGGSSTTGVGGANTSALATKCTNLCGRVIERGCPAEATLTSADCTAECDPTMLEGQPCLAEYDAWMTCFLAQPTSSWVCDESDAASPAAGACDAESTAMTNCLFDL